MPYDSCEMLWMLTPSHMHELTLKTSFEWNLTKEPAFNKTYHIEEVYYICYPSLYGQQYPPLSFFMARVCANTLEGNIKGTHQQHGLGISLHLHSRVIKPPPSEVHHKPFQIQSFKDCWKYVVTCRFHGTYHEVSSQLGNGSYASWSQANVASASEVISWIHQWWPTKTSSDILSNYSNSSGSERSLAYAKRWIWWASESELQIWWVSTTCMAIMGRAVRVVAEKPNHGKNRLSETFQKHAWPFVLHFHYRTVMHI